MTRRTWILMLGAGLCAGSLPACSLLTPWQTAGRPTGVVHETVLPEDGADVRAVKYQIEKKATDHPSGSSYAPLPPSPQVPDPLPPRPTGPQPPQLFPTGPDVAPLQQGPPLEVSIGSVPASQKPAAPTEGTVLVARPPADPPLVEALRLFLKGQAVEALNRLPNCDKTNQELLIRLLPLVARLSETSLDHLSPKDVAAFQDQLQGVEQALRPRAP